MCASTRRRKVDNADGVTGRQGRRWRRGWEATLKKGPYLGRGIAMVMPVQDWPLLQPIVVCPICCLPLTGRMVVYEYVGTVQDDRYDSWGHTLELNRHELDHLLHRSENDVIVYHMSLFRIFSAVPSLSYVITHMPSVFCVIFCV